MHGKLRTCLKTVLLVLNTFFLAKASFFEAQLIPDKKDEKAIFGNPTVSIAQGKLEGKKLDFDGKRIDRFLAIPYAEPPVGSSRLQPPEKHRGWGSDTFDASVDLTYELRAKSCLQITLTQRRVRGSEDCLFLNVWVSEGVEEARKNPKPVMVWIHGGAFSMGSGWGANFFDNWLYDHERMVAHGDIIAVTLNYRLGPLGFLSSGDSAAPGNYGLLDQLMALQWVNDNIWAFGGDLSRITIYGESAGSASVSYHMLSPLSSNLFHRGISQSGTAFSSWGIVKNPIRWAKKIAQELGCATDDSHTMMECIRYADAAALVLALPTLDKSREENVADLPWAAVIDGYFLPDTPDKLMMNSADKDYIVGHNDMDGHLFACLDFPQINIDRNPMTLDDLRKASAIFAYNVPEQVANATFFHYRPYTDNVPDDYYKKAAVMLYTDTMFASGTKLMAQYHSDIQRYASNTYMYLFSHPNKLPLGIYPSWMGADHADDLQYVFGKPYQTPLVYTKEEREITSAFMTYWTNFAWSGDPNIGPNTGPANWKPFELETRYFIEINERLVANGDSAVQSNYHPASAAFWGKMVPQLWKSSYDMEAFDVGTTLATCPGGKDFQRKTEYGCVQGESMVWSGKMYTRYLGIPFAEPPIGNQRFKAPNPPNAWDSIRDATKFQEICPQSLFDDDSMSEDCLYLNVYVPVDTTLPVNDVTPGKYPVMIWVHGGDFNSGDGSQSYHAEFMASRERVIIVTVNYRLGALGFVTTGNIQSRGNYGLLDQNMAFNWVVNNIANFGGNTEQITLFGQDAGAEAIHMHIASPLSNNLKIFQAILESGTAMKMDDYPDQIQTTLDLANALQCDITTSLTTMNCLATADVSAIINAQTSLQFRPVVDNYFLTDTPENLISNNPSIISQWSLVVGVNSGDGTEYWDKISQTSNGDEFTAVIENTFSQEYGLRTDDIEFEYTSWNVLDFETNQQEVQNQLLHLFSDYHFAAPSTKFVDEVSTAGSVVFFYQFDRVTSSNVYQAPFSTVIGAAHGAELSYIWGDFVKDTNAESNNPDDALLSYSIMKYWSNFAKTGNPNFNEMGANSEVEWPMYDNIHRKFLNLDTNISESSFLRGRQVEFWNFLLPSLHVTCPISDAVYL